MQIATTCITGPLLLQVLDKFQDKPFTCEYKYDGERAQVHILEGELTHTMCTRHLIQSQAHMMLRPSCKPPHC